MSTSSTELALAQMAQAVTLLESATAAFAAADPAAGHAAYFAWLAEQAGERLVRARIHAADGLRRSGAHQLDADSHQAIRDAGLHPTGEDLQRTRGRITTARSYFKNTLDMLKGWLNVPVSTAQDRIRQAESLIATVTEAGVRSAPLYPQLAAEFGQPDTDPGLVLTAARQIRKAEPDLGEGEAARQARTQLETDAITLIRHEPASARKHLTTMIEQSVGESRPLGALLAEAGLYRRGLRRGLMHYQLKVLPQDAELIESLCVQIDNPKTIAGNRDKLKALVAGRYARPADASLDGNPNDAELPTPDPEWGDQGSMPEWAREETPDNTREDLPDDARDDAPGDAGEHLPEDAREEAPALGASESCGEEPGAQHPATDPAQASPGSTGTVCAEPMQDETAAAKSPPDNAPPDTPGPPADVSLPPELRLPFEELRPEFRHLTALLGVLRSEGNANGKQAGLVQPEVLVFMDYDKMMAEGRNFAVTANGIPIPAGAARTMLCNAGIRSMVFGAKSQILDIAQESRFFPKYMRRALQAKYRGCAYPGCTMPASRCEADHIIPWEEGGATSVDNGCLFCPMHHHARHCGLFTVVRNEDGPPMVLLPKDLDPHQRPRINTYWLSPAEAIKAAGTTTAAPAA